MNEPRADAVNERPLEVVRRGGGSRRFLQTLIILCAISGAVICAVLLAMTLPSAGDASSASLGSRLCTPTARVNCDYVLASHWAKFRGISTSLIGFAYFCAAGLWFAAVGVPTHRARAWHLAPMALVLAGTAVSAWFVYVMATRLPVWCSWCLAAHGVNGLMLVLTLAAWPRRADGMAAYPTAWRGIGVLACCGAAAMVAAVGAWSIQLQAAARQYQREYLSATNNADYIVWRLSREPAREMAVGSDALALGAADAKNTVVVFSDFECAKCRLFHQYARRLTTIHPGAVRVILKHYPMSPQCNERVKGAFHYFACDAARAVEAARMAGGDAKALAYFEKLFDAAGLLDEKPYMPLARSLGIDAAAFERAMESEEATRRIEADVAMAASLGVEGTPAIFLDGRQLRTNWHILTDGVRPQIDLGATDSLWVELLGVSVGSGPDS
ncbi:DSBA-like thioredoxin domain protein [Phycisphaerae bacterium RAS2]|nr:DSBA-like thioredoxin domain protein [Phycisphaerae bacterium RAS2]